MTHLKKHTAFVILAMLLLTSAHSLAQPAVRLSSVSGQPGGEVEITIQAQGLSLVTAVQMNITLPQALNYVENSAVLGNEIASTNHQLQVTQTGNQLKIYVYSLQVNTLKDTQGQLLSFRLLVGKEPGTYQLKPSVVLSNSQGKDISADITMGTVTILSPSIQLSSQEIDFGRVPIKSTHSKTFIASNIGNEPLTLTGAECSINELGITGLPCTIQPGEQQELSINYTPMNAGQEDATIKIASNAANGVKTINVTALPYSVNELIVKTSDLLSVSVEMNNMEPIVAVQCSFELPKALQFIEGSIKLNNNRSKNHQLSSSFEDGKLKVFIHSASNTAIPAGNGELFSFSLQSVGASGNYQLSPSDVILSNANGNNMLSGTTDAVVHLSAPKLEVETEIDFGNLPMQESLTYSYPLKNIGESLLTIDRIEIDNPVLTISSILPFSIEAGDTKSIEIVYRPEKEGTFKGVMQVYSDDPDQRMTVVDIQGSTYYNNQVSLTGNERQDGKFALTIGLQNTLPIVALQADFHWIAGMTTNTADVLLSDRIGNHRVVLNKISDNTYRLYLYSTNNQVISPGQGALLTLIYNKVNTNINYTGSSITVDNIILSTPEGKNQSSSPVTMMTVNRKGDVNGDGLITVSDVTAVVDFLLERQTPNISLTNADVNGDGQVTIIDVVEAIQLVLTYEQ